jgi:hypothetical protein
MGDLVFSPAWTTSALLGSKSVERQFNCGQSLTIAIHSVSNQPAITSSYTSLNCRRPIVEDREERRTQKLDGWRGGVSGNAEFINRRTYFA